MKIEELMQILRDDYIFEPFIYKGEKYKSVNEFSTDVGSEQYNYALRIKIMKLDVFDEIKRLPIESLNSLKNIKIIKKIIDETGKDNHILGKYFFKYFYENDFKTTLFNRHKVNFENFVYIGRGTPFGNKNSAFEGNYDKKTSVEYYKYDFEQKIKSDIDFRTDVLFLKGRKLLCSCNNVCHGCVIVDYLDKIDFKNEVEYIKRYKDEIEKIKKKKYKP